jgi:hypothetical protein
LPVTIVVLALGSYVTFSGFVVVHPERIRAEHTPKSAKLFKFIEAVSAALKVELFRCFRLPGRHSIDAP